MATKNNFDFERLVQLFQADTSFAGYLNRDSLIDIGDIALSISYDLSSIAKTLKSVDEQLRRIADVQEKGVKTDER